MDPRKMKAINGSILVRDDKKEEVTVGGLVLPDTAEPNRVVCGEVLSTSPFLLEDGRLLDSPTKIGDKVIYGMHAGAGISWVDEADRQTYRLIKWNEIQAVQYA